jgi:GT2 family glycosyltransferase
VIIQPSATLISRAAFQAVGGFDERMCGYEDDDLFLRIFRESFDNVFIEHPTSQWRIHDSSCGASDRMDESLRYYIGKLLRSYPDDKWRGHYYARDAIAPRFINTWIQMYIRAGRYKNRAKMNEYINEAMALVPLLRWRRRIFYSVVLPLMRVPAMGQAVIAASPVLHRVYRAIFA